MMNSTLNAQQIRDTVLTQKITQNHAQIPCQLVFCKHDWRTSEAQSREENQDTVQSQELGSRRRASTAPDCQSMSSLVPGMTATADIPRYETPLLQFPAVTKPSVNVTLLATICRH